ncbi:type II toxin-antitoxin system VapC family toxin [Bradyrhizobium sediminis]|uniref:Type II toxin-antitoxin system VapC family toxin n=1 Tax=Bradyrhizobium sediminis TaxID=2840469 RepID=A0A975RMI1_9BRAD|nr:PIN domain-containing protein [Bradyrhizobium sediminis]QWG12733.1 type II toxin-antitoxin system VapC family toxin [Bradyrhizobium sediminis]
MTEASSSLVYLDTNVFIKAVEGLDEAAAPAKSLIKELRRRPAGLAATSEITLAEVLAPSRQADAMPFDMKRRAYLDLLLWSGFVALIPVGRNILIETAEQRAMHRLKLPDAVHLVSAIHAQCRFFVSADRDFERLPVGMERVDCDHAGLAGLLRELP